jgi:hypothetical protein
MVNHNRHGYNFHVLYLEVIALKELLVASANVQQAHLDQMWKILDDNYISLEQTLGCIAPSGIMHSYLTILYAQVKLNRLRKTIDEIE